MEQKKKFKLFDLNRDGKGVEEEEDRTPTLKFFFKLLGRKLTRLVSLNFLMNLMIVPILLCVYLYLSSPKTPTNLSPLYSPLYTVSLISDLPAVDIMLSTVDTQIGFPVLPVGRQIAILCIALFLILTWGMQNVGSTYVLRGLFRGDAVFILSDYFYGIKRNWKQALTLGTLDFAILAILAVDYIHLYQVTGSYWNDVMYFMIFAIAIIYFFMRFYLYLLMITFDMKWTKILKNSLIFTLLGIKRNLLAAFGILLLVVLTVVSIMLFYSTSIPIVLPFFYLFSFTAFMATYAAYPVIDRYLIKPYLASHPEPSDEPDPEGDISSGDISSKEDISSLEDSEGN